MRLFIISDIHIDFEENSIWLQRLSHQEYTEDALILAGDITHDPNNLQNMLADLRRRFARLFFVPGNHDLWLNNGNFNDSLEKLEHVLSLCREADITIEPQRTGEAGDPSAVWVVPLLSWYAQPHEGEDTLYLHKPGEDADNRMWADNYYIRWPFNDVGPSAYFYQNTRSIVDQKYDAPVISFSHFLPRQDVMFSENRQRDLERIRKFDRNPPFNFSRVAGSTLIEKQIRRLKSVIHVYGHQHINRDRTIDGVRYIAHCLGYPNERSRGQVRGLEQGLKQIWDTTQINAIPGKQQIHD